MTSLLQARGIEVRYGESEAVRGLSLAVGPGQIVTVLGPNGAGKTSLLKALMGALPCRGEIRFDGEPIHRLSLEERAEIGLSLVPEERALFGEMSVADNLELGGFLRRHEDARTRREAREEIYRLFPRLRERAGQLASTLSGGERQMLALGRALLARPRLLMLDEPSLGLAPRIVREILDAIAGLRDRGMSLLLVEQNARAALRIADYGYVIERGAVAMEGSAADLRDNPAVAATYLGGSAAG
ncbi:ABC transporter ATP-binding protein [Enterovirga aerilata]|uniref:ABC transporter ATP-binding protein n=1 Tax=Enterovirga aerilata TaxID=2730920 RepID=A0A849IGT8_9HYPH|nr:ABC transporter ATP-binding protein [Enterovirga sp. DB1703]NNM75157.1 ABC transporter ATP-binding protein [Enterovirga sp. DB1703]